MAVSPGFEGWLADNDVSLAFALPPAKLVFVGRDEGDRLSVYERTFDKTMGLARYGDTLYLGTRFQIWRFEPVPIDDDHASDGYDRCWAPRQVWVTGAVNTHDVSVDPRGGPAGGVVFVATRFSCLARPSVDCSFEPVWLPPFVSAFRPGDRCHLNGLAVDASGPAFVTAVGATDGLERWRTERAGGGVVVDVRTDSVVADGFSMPHSPRIHDGELYLTHSGAGELVRVDPTTGAAQTVGFAPGFLRGLAFVGRFAVVGSSKPRDGDLYSGLPLDAALARNGQTPRLGLFVIDIDSGRLVEWLLVDGPMREIFDVVTLPGIRRPMAYGLVGSDLRTNVWPDPSALVRRDHGWTRSGLARDRVGST